MTDGGRRRFTLGSCLGRGAYGEVYRAAMESPGGLSTAVAVKILRAEIAPGSEAVLRLRDEGRLLARLDHPAILKVHDLVLLEGRVALITELVDGADLRDLIDGPDAIGLRAVLQVVAEVAAALDAAWSSPSIDGTPLRLVHRDIKPTNIRVGKHGQIKLLDFGIARSDELEREAQTGSDVVMGSLPYMAPERFLDKRTQPASDVFGLGCVLYEALARRRFYEHALLRDVTALALNRDRFEAHRHAQLRHLPPSVPRAVADLCASLLAHDAGARPSAAALSRACEELDEDLDGPGLRRWCRSRIWAVPSAGQGTLEGRILTEGTLPLPDATPTTIVTSPGTPVVYSRPAETIDPFAAKLVTGQTVAPVGVESDGQPVAALRHKADKKPPHRSGTPRQPAPLPKKRSKKGLWAVLVGTLGLAGLVVVVAAIAVVIILLVVAALAFS